MRCRTNFPVVSARACQWRRRCGCGRVRQVPGAPALCIFQSMVLFCLLAALPARSRGRVTLPTSLPGEHFAGFLTLRTCCFVCQRFCNLLSVVVPAVCA